jgi:hypothetical protein
MERSQALKDFIEAHGALFWYTPPPKGDNVTDELLVESVLNYGSMEDIKELFRLAGLKQTAAVFKNMTGRKQLNFYPEIWNYFNLFFLRYAS